MIYSTVLLALAANALWITPGYKRLIAPRYKRVELLRDDYRTDFAKEVSKKPGVISEWANPKDIGDGVMIYYIKEQTNPLHRKPFTCSFCLAFWLGLAFALPLFVILLFSPGYGYYSLAQVAITPLAVAFLAELLNRLFNSLPIKF